MPISVLGGLSPYEILMNRKPRLDHLRIFGCLCYAKVLPSNDIFESRSIPFVMIGYSLTQNGYKLLNIENKNVFVSWDAKFVVNVFPYRNDHSETDKLFLDKVTNSYDDVEYLQMIKPPDTANSDNNDAENDEVDPILRDNLDSVETINDLNTQPSIQLRIITVFKMFYYFY